MLTKNKTDESTDKKDKQGDSYIPQILLAGIIKIQMSRQTEIETHIIKANRLPLNRKRNIFNTCTYQIAWSSKQ